MANGKEFTVGDSTSRGNSNNRRFTVSYTLNGKLVKTVGMKFKDERQAASWVTRTLGNLGISLPAGTKINVEPAAVRR